MATIINIGDLGNTEISIEPHQLIFRSDDDQVVGVELKSEIVNRLNRFRPDHSEGKDLILEIDSILERLPKYDMQSQELDIEGNCCMIDDVKKELDLLKADILLQRYSAD